MQPIEFRTRREALGLSQTELAQLLNVSQATLSAWEVGTREPRHPDSVLGDLNQLAEWASDIMDETLENLENSQVKLDSMVLTVTVYSSDEAYWAADARAKELGVPATLHRHAVGVAVLLTEVEDSVIVNIHQK